MNGAARAGRPVRSAALLMGLALMSGACGNRVLDSLDSARGVPRAGAGQSAAGLAPAASEAPGATAAGDAAAAAVAGSPSVSGSGTPTGAAAAARAGSAAPAPAAGSGAASAARTASGAPAAATGGSKAGTGSGPSSAVDPGGPAVGGSGAGPATPAGSKGTLVVGGLFHRTGPIPICTRAFEGVSAYLSDLNARGGVGGYTFKLVAYDDGEDATRNATLMKQLIERDNAAVVTECTDLTAPAGADEVTRFKVPVIGGFGANAIFYDDPHWFPNGAFQQSMYPYHAMAYGKSKFGYTKVALVYINVPQGQGGARYTRQYAAQLGLDVVYDSAYSPVEPDFTSYVVKLKQAGAQMVVLPGAGDHVIRFLKAAEQQGYDGKLIAPLTAYDPTIGPTVGKYTDGHLYTVVNHAPLELSDPVAVARYRNTTKKYFPNVTSNTYLVDGWMDGEMLEEAIRRLDGGEATRESIATALRTFKDWQGSFNPPLTFVDGPQKALYEGCDSILAARADGSFVPDSPRFVCKGQ